MKINSKYCLLLVLLLPLQSLAQLKVSGLQCDYKANPQGIESIAPHLSWQLHSTQQNVLQTAYRILVTDGLNTVWDSKKAPVSLR